MSTIVDTVRDYLGRQSVDIVAAYLYGSQARATAGPGSDIDLALLMRALPPRTLIGQPFALADDLGELTKHPVQIIVLNDAPVDLVHRVLRDGVLLVDRDPSARIQFEVSARNAYFDLKPFLDRYRRTG